MVLDKTEHARGGNSLKMKGSDRNAQRGSRRTGVLLAKAGDARKPSKSPKNKKKEGKARTGL